MKITNYMLRKELKNYVSYLVLSIIFIIIFLVTSIIYFCKSNNLPKESVYLNDVILSMNNKINITAHLKINKAPFSFAKYSDEQDKAYYIVFDGNYYYIVYMTDKEYQKISKEVKKKSITIYGTTTYTTSDIRALALDAYNEGLEEENKITEEDFNNYFGEIYLDITKSDNFKNTLLIVISSSVVLASLCLVIFGIKKRKSNKILSSISEKNIEKLEKELREEDTLYFSKNHLILTKNHVVTFINNFKIIDYKDIIWIYENEITQKLFTIERSINVMNTKKENITIMKISGMNKKNELIVNNIINLISKKNKNMLVGFNKENKKKIKELNKG